MSLPNQLKKLLLDQPSKFADPVHPDWAPEKPDALYRHRVVVTRTQTIELFIDAIDDDHASELITNGEVPLDWSQATVEDPYVDELDPLDECLNQADLDEWDALYCNRYNENGMPMCSLCGDMFDSADELTVAPDDPEEWLCAFCLPDDEDA